MEGGFIVGGSSSDGMDGVQIEGKLMSYSLRLKLKNGISFVFLYLKG